MCRTRCRLIRSPWRNCRRVAIPWSGQSVPAKSGLMTVDAIAYANAACLQLRPDRKVNYLELEPIAALKADVEYCWILRASEPLATPLITRSPGKCSVDLVVPIDGNFCENAERHLFGSGPLGPYLVGPLSQPARLVSTGRCTVLGMRFRPGRSRPFFRFPVHELRDRVLSMQSVDQGFARAATATRLTSFGSSRPL